ncbi:MAG: autotransporter domain-containing protein [Burkholderiaceae bacterium]|nr:autotransporter domain-containing protein [Burkholderiaceae bacterium]
MNRFYRVLFNRSLSVWQAVPETAKAQGKGGKPVKAVAVALLALGAAQTALAADVTWSGGAPDNYWHTGNNWVGGIAPEAGDWVFISSPDSQVNQLVIKTDSTLSNSLYLGLTDFGPVDVTLSAGTGINASLDGPLSIAHGSTLRIGSEGHNGTLALLTLLAVEGVTPRNFTLSVEHGTFRPQGFHAAGLTSTTGSTLNVGEDGIYDLNGIGGMTQKLTGSGHIRNDGAADAQLAVFQNSTFDGVIQDGDKKTSLITSGHLTLTGTNTYTGGTMVTAGTLQIDGSLVNSDVAVQHGATLIANGTLGGAVNVQATGRLLGVGTVGDTLVSGTVAPGSAAIGTLNVAGNIAFNPGSVYQVKVDASGTSDRIQAAGISTLNGGTVQVLAGAGRYAPSTSYTILTAQGGRTGTFDNVSSNLAFLTPTLDYDANNVHLTMTRNKQDFAGVGHTPNQMAVGRNVESLSPSNAIYDAILNLSAEQARPAFDALSGEIHASVRTALLEDSRFVRNAANDSLRAAQTASGRPGSGLTAPVAGSGAAFWALGLGSWGSSNSDGNAGRLSRDSHGLLLGVDDSVGDWRVGVLTGYGDTSAKASERNASASSRNFHLGVYGGKEWGNLALRAGTAYSWHSMKTHRNVTMPGFSDSLKDKYRAHTWQTFAELGYGMAAAENTRIEPFINLAHVRLRTNGYTEQGGAAALNGGSADTNLTFTTLGLRAEHQAMVGSTEITLSGLLGWRRAFGDTMPTATHGFQGAGSAFTVAGVLIAKNSALIEAGVNVKLSPVANLGLAYTGQLASSARDHGVRANFTVRF